MKVLAVSYRETQSGKERKGKWTCIAPIISTSTTKRSDVDHTELPANTEGSMSTWT